MIELKDLLKAGVHFGHKSSRWSPKMRPFIWGSKNKIHLINVAKTAFLMNRAGNYLKDLAANGKSVLWVGTKKAARPIVSDIATSLKMPFVINRWIGGTLTNFQQVKKAITRLLHLEDVLKKPSSLYKKKELSMIQKEIGRLEKNIGGIINLDFPPAAIIIVDAKKEHSTIKEAVVAGIPIIAMVDTNTDPEGINFVIPANDDSPRSIEFVTQYLATCLQDGKKVYEESKKEDLELRKKAKEPVKKAAPKAASKPAPKAPTKEVVKAETKTLPSTPTEKTAKDAVKTSLKKEISAESKASTDAKAMTDKMADKKEEKAEASADAKAVVDKKTVEKKATPKPAKSSSVKTTADKKTADKK